MAMCCSCPVTRIARRRPIPRERMAQRLFTASLDSFKSRPSNGPWKYRLQQTARFQHGSHFCTFRDFLILESPKPWEKQFVRHYRLFSKDVKILLNSETTQKSAKNRLLRYKKISESAALFRISRIYELRTNQQVASPFLVPTFFRLGSVKGANPL